MNTVRITQFLMKKCNLELDSFSRTKFSLPVNVANGFCGCHLGILSCPVALAEYLESSLEGNIIFNTLFMLNGLVFSTFLV